MRGAKAMAIALSIFPLALSAQARAAADPAFATFVAALNSPDAVLVRVFSVRPGDTSLVLRESPPRKGGDVEDFAAVKCEVPLTAGLRGTLLAAVQQSTVWPSKNDKRNLDWAVEIRSARGDTLASAYFGTDWIGYDRTGAEIDGKNVDVDKHVIDWIETNFPVKGCWFEGGAPNEILTFRELDEKIRVVE